MAENEQHPSVVILTALSVEYEAARAHLTGIRKLTHPLGTRFDLGRLPGTPGSLPWGRSARATGQER